MYVFYFTHACVYIMMGFLSQITTLESEIQFRDQQLVNQRVTSEQELQVVTEREMNPMRLGTSGSEEESDRGLLSEEPIYDEPPEVRRDTYVIYQARISLIQQI